MRKLITCGIIVSWMVVVEASGCRKTRGAMLGASIVQRDHSAVDFALGRSSDVIFLSGIFADTMALEVV